MKGLLELVLLVTVIVFFGALFWAGMGVLSVSREIGDGSLATESAVRRPLVVAGLALALNLVAQFMRKRL